MNEKRCRAFVSERARGRCERCGRFVHTTMHHRKKRSQGGGWTPENIVAVCGHGTVGCHGWIEHHPRLAHETGWHVKPWEDPASITPQPLYLQKPSEQSPDFDPHTDGADWF